MSVHVRGFTGADRPWAIELMRERWGGQVVVTCGKARDASLLEGFVAEIDAEPVGLAIYETRGAESELVMLDCLREGVGVGSALLAAVANAAWRQECRRLSVVTTNDNVRALGFYQRRGFVLTALRKGAIEKYRQIKPEIPELGFDDIPIRDELELVLTLRENEVSSAGATRAAQSPGPSQAST